MRKRIKKEKKTEKTHAVPRFRQGAGTNSWKLAVALVIALAVGVGGGILVNNTKQRPKLTDYQLGIEMEHSSQSAQG